MERWYEIARYRRPNLRDLERERASCAMLRPVLQVLSVEGTSGVKNDRQAITQSQCHAESYGDESRQAYARGLRQRRRHVRHRS